MKKQIVLLLTVLLVCSFFFSCAENPEKEAESVLSKQYEECIAAFSDAHDDKDIRDYLLKWANANKIKVSFDKSGNIIMSSAASEGYTEAPSTIFQCTLDPDHIENTALSVSTIQYLLRDTESHGFLRALFTTKTDGIENVSRNYLSASNFISLDWHESGELLVGSAGSEYYTMKQPLAWKNPSYTHTYRIEVTGPEGIPCSESHRPNPIRIIGNLLAQAQSRGILLEIAEFSGGSSADTYPANVSCVILVNQNDISKLEKRLQNAKEDFEARYTSDEEAYSFTFTETETPRQVIEYQDTANLISFLYTCISGTYLKDDAGEVIALSNIGRIDATGENLEIEVCTLSKSSDILREMNSVLDTVCGLCDISYTMREGTPIWEDLTIVDDGKYSESETLESSYPENSVLVDTLEQQYSAVLGKGTKKVRSFEKTACSFAARKIASMNVVAFGITKENHFSETEVLVQYLGNLH